MWVGGAQSQVHIAPPVVKLPDCDRHDPRGMPSAFCSFFGSMSDSNSQQTKLD